MIADFHYPPLTMRAPEAARFLSMSEAKFKKLVAENRLPPARKVDRMSMWLTAELRDAARQLLEIEEDGGDNEWDAA